MSDTATKTRSEIDDAALEEELAAERGSDDDGLGPAGEQPPDPDPPAPAAAAGGEAEPPTPPAKLPDDGDDDPEDAAPQLFLMGNRQLGVKVGGKKPESSVLKFKGGKVDLDGQFDLEDRITTVDIWQVTGDNDQHTIEKATGAVKSASKAQNATLCATAKLEDWLAERLEDPELIAIVFARLELDVPEG